MYKAVSQAKLRQHYSCAPEVFFPTDQELRLRSHVINYNVYYEVDEHAWRGCVVLISWPMLSEDST